MRPDITLDSLLGGRLVLAQPRRGHRFGHDAVLLAAAVPAYAGDHAVDLGAGVGAAGLALASRIAGLRVTLVERDPELVRLAVDNIGRNEFAGRVTAAAIDVLGRARAFAEAGVAPESADHVLTNPPFYGDDAAQSSPEPRRRAAHSWASGSLGNWIKAANRILRAHGTITLIDRADNLGDVIAALAPAFGSLCVIAFHGKPGSPAIRVLVNAVKGSRGRLSLWPPLVLTDEKGRPTACSETIVRAGAALPMRQGVT